MITYNYEIERDEKDEKKIYKPSNILKKLDNITYIEGPNSSGKSTLLNILAIGFYGLKNGKILPTLKSDMNNLFNSKHQVLNFEFTVKLPEENIELFSKGDSKEQKVDFFEVIDGKKNRLTPETFERKYNLIYDIPDRPRERIKQLSSEIKEFQGRYGNTLLEFKNYIWRIINDIKLAKDPKKIDQLKNQKSEVEKEKEELLKTKEAKENELELLEKTIYHDFYKKYSGLYYNTENQIEEATNEQEDFRKKLKRDKKEYKEINYTTKLLFLEFKKKYDELTLNLEIILPSNEKYNLNRWKRIDMMECFSDYEFPKTMHECLSTFDKIIKDLLEKKEKEETAKEAEMVDELLRVLDGYKTFNFKIPGIGKTVQEFILDLKKLEKEMKSVISYTNSLNRSSVLLEDVREAVDKLEKEHFPNLIRIKEEDKKYSKEFSKISALNSKLAALREDEEKYREKLNFYEKNYQNVGKPSANDIGKIGSGELKSYANLTEEQLLDELESLQNEVNDFEQQINGKGRLIERYDYDLKILESKEPHEFQDKLEILTDLHRRVTILDRKLRVDFKNFITDLIEGNLIGKEIDSKQERYNQAIFQYLAKRIGKIRHIDHEYIPINVNLLEGYIETEKGKRIMLSDMGTGQSQSAYLLGLLNAADERKIIALFDEVANMDNSSLRPIYDKFKDLYNNKKLVLGIVVQKAEKLSVKSKLI